MYTNIYINIYWPNVVNGNLIIKCGDFPGGLVIKTWLPMQGVRVSIPGCRAVRSHMPHDQKNQNINNRTNVITNSIKTLKIVHIKKNLWKNNSNNKVVGRGPREIYNLKISLNSSDVYPSLKKSKENRRDAIAT